MTRRAGRGRPRPLALALALGVFAATAHPDPRASASEPEPAPPRLGSPGAPRTHPRAIPRTGHGEKPAADSLATRWRIVYGATASIPHGHAGVFFSGLAPGGHGFYADARIMLSRPAGSEAPLPFRAEDIEAEPFQLRETFENWFAIDLAYARPSGFSFGAGPGVAYIGAGWSHVDVEKRYQNRNGQGSFWVYDDRKERGRAHGLLGLIVPVVRVNEIRVGIQAAVEGPPAGATLGVGVMQAGP